ncbi:MAG: CoA-transferase [Halobacteriales archaeon]|nr:CoA-transferase [Halobacteriales archaeon]
MGELTSMEDAIDAAVEDGQTLYLGGFTHLIPFAAGHEIIRQGYESLTAARATPDLIYDQLIAAGCVDDVIFSWAGNPGVGSLRAFRRAFEEGIPQPITIDEYSHFGTVTRLEAGARRLPFLPLRSYVGSDYIEHNDSDSAAGEPLRRGPRRDSRRAGPQPRRGYRPRPACDQRRQRTAVGYPR